MDSYNKIWSVIRNTDLLNNDEKIELHLYLFNLNEQFKKQTEVIDKAINILCEIDSCNMKKQYRQANLLVLKLKDILKEVE